MKNYRHITAALAIAVAVTAAGCGAEDDVETDECLNDSDCAAGLICVDDDPDQLNVCVVAGVDECTFERCQAGRCEGPEWTYIALVSTATSDAELLDTNAPGPDIDAIELVAAGDSTFASDVPASNQGDPVSGNQNNDVRAVLGANDAIAIGGSECLLDESVLWSMGDNSGFVIVSFDGLALEDGNSIRSWEASSLVCTNLSDTQPDSFDVYVGLRSVNLAEIDTAEDFVGASGWMPLGRSLGSGGLSEHTVDLPCP